MLYIVVTPIGNLGDITYRAVEVLKKADIILCEDTRHSAVLLSRYGITAPTRAYEKFSEARVADRIADELAAGKEIALISDAGTPLISDPGKILVDRLRERGLPYTVVGSGCAAISALILSGADTSSFCFVGFLPEKRADRERAMKKFADMQCTLVFYVAPHDIAETVAYLGETLGARKACLVREISKLYEESIRFTLPDLPENVTLKGEMVLVVDGAEKSAPYAELDVKAHYEKYVAEGLSDKEALKAVARDRGVSKSEIYAQIKRK